MNEIISVNNDTQTVSARELHEQLKIGTEFAKWFARMCEYGFTEGIDFNSVKNDEVRFEGNREVKRSLMDADISIDMAKQICMIQRTPEGKKVRQYLIDLEKAWNTPELVMARGLRASQLLLEQKDKVIAEQLAKIEEMKPKERFADAVSASNTDILIGDLAKILRGNGIPVGQNRLFKQLREKGFLCKAKGDNYNMPTQKAMELGIFRIKETVITNPDGSVRITKTTKVTGKGQQYIINKYLSGEWKV